jgi:hypothetical protein
LWLRSAAPDRCAPAGHKLDLAMERVTRRANNRSPNVRSPVRLDRSAARRLLGGVLMASPAQIANDMAAHAAWWAKRDADLARLCRDSARVIRMLISGEKLDGRTYGGLHRRLLDRRRDGPDLHLKGYPDFDRARICLECLQAELRGKEGRP